MSQGDRPRLAVTPRDFTYAIWKFPYIVSEILYSTLMVAEAVELAIYAKAHFTRVHLLVHHVSVDSPLTRNIPRGVL